MTVQLPERVEPDTINLENFEFEVVCDIATARAHGDGTGFPPCKGEPARWVAWREAKCGHGPRYRLICDFCKQYHQNQIARGTFFYCGQCGQEAGPYVAFTPLKGKG